MATQLRMDPDMVMGKLVRLWSWAEVNRIKCNDLGVTRAFLDKLVGKKGFASALECCGWLREEDGKMIFPNFERHNGPDGKGRALTAMRVARHRRLKRESNDLAPLEIEQQRFERVAPTGVELVRATAHGVKTVASGSAVLQEKSARMEPAAEQVEPFAQAAGEVEEEPGPAREERGRKKRSRTTSSLIRKASVLEPPEQPLLLGL